MRLILLCLIEPTSRKLNFFREWFLQLSMFSKCCFSFSIFSNFQSSYSYFSTTNFRTKFLCLWRWKATGSWPNLSIFMFMPNLWFSLSSKFPFNFSMFDKLSLFFLLLSWISATSWSPPLLILSSSLSNSIWFWIFWVSFKQVSSVALISS